MRSVIIDVMGPGKGLSIRLILIAGARDSGKGKEDSGKDKKKEKKKKKNEKKKR